MTEVAPHEPDAPVLDDVERRILAATLELVTAGGYEAVRQREVAARAGVALATVYARFGSKDILLATALELDSRRYVEQLRRIPVRGRTPLVRVTKLFEHMTELLLERPEFARASLRTAMSGDHEAMLRQMVGQQRLHAVIVDALRGSKKAPALRREPALRVATVLVMVWFANLVAWSAGVVDAAMLVAIVRETASMLLHGVQEPE